MCKECDRKYEHFSPDCGIIWQFICPESKERKKIVNRNNLVKNAMQHIYVMQQLTVVENTIQTSTVVSANDDIEGETCLRHTSIIFANNVPFIISRVRGDLHV